jgi:hypothetical protein
MENEMLYYGSPVIVDKPLFGYGKESMTMVRASTALRIKLLLENGLVSMRRKTGSSMNTR